MCTKEPLDGVRWKFAVAPFHLLTDIYFSKACARLSDSENTDEKIKQQNQNKTCTGMEAEVGKEDLQTAGLHQDMTFLFPVTSKVDGTKQKNVCMGAYYTVPTPDLLVVVNLKIQRVHVHSCSMTVLNVLNQLYLRNKAYLMFYQNVCAEFILFFTQPGKSTEKRWHSLNNHPRRPRGS